MDRKTTNGKRKSAAAHHSIVSPRFISCKMMRKSIVPRPVNPWVKPEEASYASLPREIFCNIVAYLGPTSSSLCTLSQVTRDHNAIMTSIGDVMLQRARLRFRTPLSPKSEYESSISLFVRHARVSKAVHDKLEVLNQVLKKDFPVINTLTLEDTTKFPLEMVSIHNFEPKLIFSSDGNSVEPSEVNNALNIALCLLGCWKQHYFEDAHEAQEIAKSAATTALEWRVSSLCSKLGAKAYKYAKSRMCRRYEQEDDLLSADTVTDEMRLEEDSDYDYDEDLSIDSNLSIDSSEFDDDEDMTILDKASLVMQHVVLREQRRARLNSQTAAAMVAKRVHNMHILH